MHTRNIYSIVTLKDGRADSEEIIEIFSNMFSGKIKCDLKLLNYYRQIPVSYSASIVNISRDRVEFKIHQNQALVMKLDKHTLIKSSHFPKGLGVHCFTAYINVHKEVSILTRFAYAQIKAERRGAVRVTVPPGISAVFANSELEISGSILDLSERGISILTNTEPVISEQFDGLLVLQIEGHKMEIPTCLLKTFPADEGYVSIFQYELKGVPEKVLSRYIYSRQVEIIKELKDHL